jgi:hypothetical protein
VGGRAIAVLTHSGFMLPTPDNHLTARAVREFLSIPVEWYFHLALRTSEHARVARRGRARQRAQRRVRGDLHDRGRRGARAARRREGRGAAGGDPQGQAPGQGAPETTQGAAMHVFPLEKTRVTGRDGATAGRADVLPRRART